MLLCALKPGGKVGWGTTVTSDLNVLPVHFITKAHHSGSAGWLTDVEVGSLPSPRKSSAGAQMKIHCGFDIWGSETLLNFCFLFYMPREGGERERDKEGRQGEWGGLVLCLEDPSSPQNLWHFPGWPPLSSLSFPICLENNAQGISKGAYSFSRLPEGLLFYCMSLV